MFRGWCRSLTLTLLDTHDEERRPLVKGWRSKGGDLPVVLSNASDVEEHIPGRASPHRIVVHPTPGEYVAVVWKSPIDGNIRAQGHVVHVHPGCGNGIAWWIEHRHADQAGILAEGKIAPDQEARVPARNLNVAKGDLLILAVDANGDHSCDLTEVSLDITQPGNSAQEWNLANDVADTILDANPHADRLGNKDVWSFVKGPTRPVVGGESAIAIIPGESVLARWQEVVIDPARQDEAAKFAEKVQKLLAGPATEQRVCIGSAPLRATDFRGRPFASRPGPFETGRRCKAGRTFRTRRVAIWNRFGGEVH